MRKHDLTNKKTTAKTKTMKMTNTFRAFKELSLRLLTYETFDQNFCDVFKTGSSCWWEVGLCEM